MLGEKEGALRILGIRRDGDGNLPPISLHNGPISVHQPEAGEISRIHEKPPLRAEEREGFIPQGELPGMKEDRPAMEPEQPIF